MRQPRVCVGAIKLIAPAFFQQHEMIVNESSRNVPDVAGKVHEHCGQRSELNHRNRSRGLLRSEPEIHRPAREHQMRRRADGNEFS